VKIVGRYELLDPIGYGGMAVVYLARQTDLDRQVALKELRMFDAPDDPAQAERFLREARVAGSMSHPNIVTVHEYFKHAGTPYIAMEYLQRGSLRPWVGRMSVAQIAGVLEGLLAALDHAERYRIVHRDLKPENLLVTDQGQIKVADFGIAKARTMNTSLLLTAAGTTVGTPSYMAPEQAMAHELGPYTDLYSVGIMAYELFTGRIPFDDTDTPVAIILRHVNEEIPSAYTVNPAVDRALSDWIDRLLVKDPAERTQTAEEAWDQLEEVVLRLLGSRWRRGARLAPTAEQPVAAPLTPAPFTSTDVDTPVPQAPSDEFQSFAWGAAPVAPVDPRVASDAGAVGPAAPSGPSGPQAVTPQPESEPTQPQPEPEPGVRPVESEPSFVTFKPSPVHEPVQPIARAEPVDRPALAAPPPPPPTPMPTRPASPGPAPASIGAQPDVEARTVMPYVVPERPQPPSRSTPSPQIRRRRIVALAGAAAAVVTVAVVAVLLAGGSGSSDETPAGTSVLDNADLALAVPTSWSERPVPKIPGLHRQRAVAAAPASYPYVVAELVRGQADPTLLPPRLLAALQARRPKPVTITLAEQKAYRYDTLQRRGSNERMRIYALLTTGGVATVACVTPAAATATAARDCDRIAGTLKLTSAQALPVGPSKDYAATLKKTFTTLDGRLKTVKSRLAKARTVTAQAAALRLSGVAYEGAVASLRADPLNAVDAGLNAELTSLLDSATSVYRRLELAVRRDNAAARARAQLALKRLRAKIDDANATLAKVGYADDVPGLPVTRVMAPRRPVARPPTRVAPAPNAPAPQAPAPVAPRQAAPPPPPPPPPAPEVGGGDIG
jgi:serine/threonine protein kinase